MRPRRLVGRRQGRGSEVGLGQSSRVLLQTLEGRYWPALVAGAGVLSCARPRCSKRIAVCAGLRHVDCPWGAIRPEREMVLGNTCREDRLDCLARWSGDRGDRSRDHQRVGVLKVLVHPHEGALLGPGRVSGCSLPLGGVEYVPPLLGLAGGWAHILVDLDEEVARLEAVRGRPRLARRGAVVQEHALTLGVEVPEGGRPLVSGRLGLITRHAVQVRVQLCGRLSYEVSMVLQVLRLLPHPELCNLLVHHAGCFVVGRQELIAVQPAVA